MMETTFETNDTINQLILGIVSSHFIASGLYKTIVTALLFD